MHFHKSNITYTEKNTVESTTSMQLNFINSMILLINTFILLFYKLKSFLQEYDTFKKFYYINYISIIPLNK